MSPALAGGFFITEPSWESKIRFYVLMLNIFFFFRSVVDLQSCVIVCCTTK